MTKKETILAVDVGRTNCRVVIFSSEGKLREHDSRSYPTYYQQPGWVEQDPEDWWVAVLPGIRQLQQRAPVAVGTVAAIRVTVNMHALVCLGLCGKALGRALVLGDQQSVTEANDITAEMGTEHIYALTGARMDASTPLAKLRWLHTPAPEIHRRARAFLACKGYVRHLFTGDLLTDPIDACGTSLYDIQRQMWSPELVTFAGIRLDFHGTNHWLLTQGRWIPSVRPGIVEPRNAHGGFRTPL